jgi:riboflavin synthase
MFNGIIKNTGRVKKINKKNNNTILEIFSNIKLKKDEVGSSISCSGACLTVETYHKNSIRFFISKETLSKTIFKSSKKGDKINLEKPLKYGERISGHFVQGHVDTTSSIKKINIIGKSWLINFQLTKKYRRLIVSKGSIAINGVSLTIAKVLRSGFQVAIIPKTLKLTNLINLKEGDIVNVEFDVLGKYIKSFMKLKS